MIKLQTSMAGRFKLEKYKADRDGNPIAETKEVVADWFDNLILDQGLNRLGSSTLSSSTGTIQVGSGGSAPEASDAGLDAFIAASSSSQGQVDGVQVSDEPYYLFRRVTRRFSAGSAAGNLSEVGAGWGSSAVGNLFSRALIVDSQGSPTTITVLSDEVLDVTYEIRVYPDSTDSVGTIELEGELFDYTARAWDIDSIYSAEQWSFSRSGVSSAGFARAYDGGIGGILTGPSGANDDPSSRTNGSYSQGSMVGSASYTWGLNRGNIGGIRSVRLPVGWSVWQIEFSSQVDGSPIPKDDTKELTLTVSHSWARRAD